MALSDLRTSLYVLIACTLMCLPMQSLTAQAAEKAKKSKSAKSPALTLAGKIPMPTAKPGAGQIAAFGATDPVSGMKTRAFVPQSVENATDPQLSTPAPIGDGIVYLVARLTETGVPLDSGIVWRVFSETGTGAQPLTLMETATGGDAEFRLPAGEYVVHAAYGQAGQSKRIYVGGDVKSETMVLNAGGLRLAAAIAEDLPIGADAVTYDLYLIDETVANGREVVASNVQSGQIYRLNAGTYQVVSRYGGINAVVRAEISVLPGQLTDATIYHRAAEVTLKLVNDAGGEALANTAWTIMTPEDKTVFEKIGAFPSVVLAEGTYTIIARHEIGTFTRQFSVEAGLSRDVEVLTIGTQ